MDSARLRVAASVSPALYCAMDDLQAVPSTERHRLEDRGEIDTLRARYPGLRRYVPQWHTLTEDLFTATGLSAHPFKWVLALLPIRQALFEHLHITIPSTV
jgi:hypothetical protein